jgi:hypothetical protein
MNEPPLSKARDINIPLELWQVLRHQEGAECHICRKPGPACRCSDALVEARWTGAVGGAE